MGLVLTLGEGPVELGEDELDDDGGSKLGASSLSFLHS